MIKVDAKFYGEVRKIKDDTVVPEGSFVVFLAKDNAFAETLPLYRQKCIELGADDEQVAAVDRMIERLLMWRETNAHLCKVPDAKGDKLDEPA